MLEIDTLIEADGWAREIADPEALVRNCVSAASKADALLAGGASVLLADDDTLRQLNRRFRDVDKPTNVLSFPSGEKAPAFLGDIALAFETCQRQAGEQGIAMADHAAHLIVHGLLHLAGYDHENEAGAEVMEAKETAILAMLGVSDPYALEELNN